jgi:ribose transport system permease protein
MNRRGNAEENNMKINNYVEKYNLVENLQKYGTLSAMVILALIFSILNPGFLGINNLLTILMQFSLLAILSVGILFPMIAGVFDLSGTEMIFFISAMTCILINSNIVTNFFTLLISMALIGIFVGFIKAVAVTYIRLPSLLVTLAIGQVLMGIGRWYTNNRPIYVSGKINLISEVSESSILRIPTPFIILLVVTLILYVLLYKTRFGSRLYMLGSTELAAEEASLNVKYYQVIAYIISGLMGALSSLILISRIQGANPDVGKNFTIITIASVFIGMTMFKRGEPNLLGTIFAVLLLAMIANGFVLIGLSVYVQDTLIGILILATVSTSVYLRKLKYK